MHAPITSISPETFLAIMAAIAVAGTAAALASRTGLTVPAVVAELLAGIVLGPHVLGLQVSSSVLFFKNLGLGLLFFYVGYEIDFRRIAGRPLRLGLLGWVLSLVLACTAVAVLHWAGIAVSILYCGPAVATTAIGTLIPVLSDSGELDTPLGTYLLAAGAVGEFGPILLLTVGLSTQSSVHSALILLVFAAVTIVLGVAAIRARRPALRWFERTLESSSQLAVRWVLVLLFGLALLAYRLGLDLLLGGFVAGVIVRELLRGTELPGFDSKLTAIAFGLFVPFFFVVSGMTLDISSFASAGGILLTGLFCLLMLLVRGTPALILYRREFDARRRRALGLLSSAQLPLVLAITALATASGRMSPSTAADLVGAALLSTLIFPLLGLRLSGERSWQSEAGEETPLAEPRDRLAALVLVGLGRHRQPASSVSSDTIRLVSPRSTAVAKCPTSSSSRGEPGSGVRSRPPAGSRSSRAARARQWSRLQAGRSDDLGTQG